MSNWNTDKIIGTGLIFALIVYIIGFFVINFFVGISPPLDVASNIVTGLAGYMGRSLLEKRKDDKEAEKDGKSQHQGNESSTAERSDAGSAPND